MDEMRGKERSGQRNDVAFASCKCSFTFCKTIFGPRRCVVLRFAHRGVTSKFANRGVAFKVNPSRNDLAAACDELTFITQLSIMIAPLGLQE